MLQGLFPTNILEALQKLNINKLYEIRLRVGQAIIVDYAGTYFLSVDGITDKESNAIICDKKLIDLIIANACNNSVYAFNDEIKQGFITFSKGIRIGLAGQCVIDGEQTKTIKNLTSLNIRIPHVIKNCSLPIFDYVAKPLIQNTLIISPPGAGKTTFLRDIAYQISSNLNKNVLIVDERNEIANCVNGIPQNTFGNFCDILTNCTKQFGLENGIRSLRPDVVITDEIANLEDINAIVYALGCGVKVFATAHCDDIENLKLKKNFEKIIENKYFDRYVILSSDEGPGTIDSVYDKNFKCIYF